MKIMEITRSEALAMENRYSDVRRFLENADIVTVTELYREHMPVLTRDDMIEAIMCAGQMTIDAIYNAEALDEPPFDRDEQDQK